MERQTSVITTYDADGNLVKRARVAIPLNFPLRQEGTMSYTGIDQHKRTSVLTTYDADVGRRLAETAPEHLTWGEGDARLQQTPYSLDACICREAADATTFRW